MAVTINAPYSYAEEDGEMELIVTKSIRVPKIPAQGLASGRYKGLTDQDSDDTNKPFLTYWRTERERKALMLNRIEQTRLETNVWSLNRAKTIAERSMSHDINATRNKWSKFIRNTESRSSSLRARATSLDRRNSAPLFSVTKASISASLLEPKMRPTSTFISSDIKGYCALCKRIKELIKGKDKNGKIESPITVIDLVRIREPVADEILTMYAQHVQECSENIEGGTSASHNMKSSGARSTIFRGQSESALHMEITSRGETEASDKMQNVLKTVNSHEINPDLSPELGSAEKDSLNYKMYDFLRRQKSFNEECSVQRELAMRNELQRYQHASLQQSVSLLGSRWQRPSVQKNLHEKAQKMVENLPMPKRSVAVIRWSDMS